VAAEIHRYVFMEQVPSEDIEAALLLAIWGCEALHGELQTRLDACHYLDSDAHACVIDAGSTVGMDLSRLFLAFLRRECGDDSFKVECIDALPARHAA
jgi:hypothetical protein